MLVVACLRNGPWDSCVLLHIPSYSFFSNSRMCSICMCPNRIGSSVGENGFIQCRVDSKDNVPGLGLWLDVVVALHYEGSLWGWSFVSLLLQSFIILCLVLCHLFTSQYLLVPHPWKVLPANPSPMWGLLKGVVMHSHYLKMTWRS